MPSLRPGNLPAPAGRRRAGRRGGRPALRDDTLRSPHEHLLRHDLRHRNVHPTQRDVPPYDRVVRLQAGERLRESGRSLLRRPHAARVVAARADLLPDPHRRLVPATESAPHRAAVRVLDRVHKRDAVRVADVHADVVAPVASGPRLALRLADAFVRYVCRALSRTRGFVRAHVADGGCSRIGATSPSRRRVLNTCREPPKCCAQLADYRAGRSR